MENEQALHVNCVYWCSPCCPPQSSFSCPWEAQPESLGSSWLIVRKEMRGRERESGIPRLWAPEERWQTLGRWQRSWKKEKSASCCRPLRDTSSFQKLDFINQTSRSYLSLLSGLLLGHNPVVYLEGISSVTQSWEGTQILGFDETVLRGGLESSSEPGLGGGFWRKGNCHSSQTLNHRSWVVRNPGLPQNSQLCGELSYSLCFRLFSNLVTSQILGILGSTRETATDL